MDPNEALNLVDQICSQVALKRNEHALVNEAIQTLQNVITLRKSEEDILSEAPKQSTGD